MRVQRRTKTIQVVACALFVIVVVVGRSVDCMELNLIFPEFSNSCFGQFNTCRNSFVCFIFFSLVFSLCIVIYHIIISVTNISRNFTSISSPCYARMSAEIIIPTHLLKLIKIHPMKTSYFGKMIAQRSFGNTINKFS